MFNIKMTTKTAYRLICFATFLLSIPAARAQSLEHVREFWDFAADIQFLPGGFVVVENESGTERYLYKGSNFERFQGEIPVAIESWSSFDWSVDYLDQVDRAGTIPADLRTFLPRRVKIKKFYEIFLPGDKSSLSLVCYTRRSAGKFADPQRTDIFLIAVLNTNPHDTRSRYHQLWSRRLKPESNFGDFQYQILPGVGKFILLYSSETTGDSVLHKLDVYRLKGM